MCHVLSCANKDIIIIIKIIIIAHYTFIKPILKSFLGFLFDFAIPYLIPCLGLTFCVDVDLVRVISNMVRVLFRCSVIEC